MGGPLGLVVGVVDHEITIGLINVFGTVGKGQEGCLTGIDIQRVTLVGDCCVIVRLVSKQSK